VCVCVCVCLCVSTPPRGGLHKRQRGGVLASVRGGLHRIMHCPRPNPTHSTVSLCFAITQHPGPWEARHSQSPQQGPGTHFHLQSSGRLLDAIYLTRELFSLRHVHVDVHVDKQSQTYASMTISNTDIIIHIILEIIRYY